MTLHPLFPMPLSFYFSDFPSFYLSATRAQTCGSATEVVSSLLPGLKAVQKNEPFLKLPMIFGMSLISSSLLPTWEGPTAIVGIPLVLFHTAAAWCHFAERPEFPARLPGRPGILYFLGHPPHLSLLLPTVWNWRTSVSSGCDTSFFHVVNSEFSRWRSQAVLLLCNSHLTPECSTSVKAMAAKLFFSDSLLTTPTGWWRAWSSSRVAGHSSHYSSTAVPGAHYPLASAP